MICLTTCLANIAVSPYHHPPTILIIITILNYTKKPSPSSSSYHMYAVQFHPCLPHRSHHSSKSLKLPPSIPADDDDDVRLLLFTVGGGDGVPWAVMMASGVKDEKKVALGFVWWLHIFTLWAVVGYHVTIFPSSPSSMQHQQLTETTHLLRHTCGCITLLA